jgi:DNA-binding CsgD family transcriptional regulator
MTGKGFIELNHTLATGNDDPSKIAARHLDWQMVLAGLTKLDLAIVRALADGLTLRQIARAYKMNINRLRELQRRLAAKVVEVMGLDAIDCARVRPQWKINLLTINEQLACRGDRKAAVDRMFELTVHWIRVSRGARQSWLSAHFSTLSFRHL